MAHPYSAIHQCHPPAKQHSKQTTSEEEKLKLELDRATKAKQAAAKHVEELKKDLQALKGDSKEASAEPAKKSK